MFSAVFRCFQLGCNFYRIAPCAMHNHPLCAHFVELPLWSVAGSGCFGWKSNWTKFDHVGNTGGYWETMSSSLSISFGSSKSAYAFYIVFSPWHPLCAHFVELPLWSVEISSRSGCFCWKSNWTKFDQVENTGGHWETTAAAFYHRQVILELVWSDITYPNRTGPDRHFSVLLLKSSSNWTKLSLRGPQLFSRWYQMILGVFRCTQLFSDVFRLFSNCFPTMFSDCWNPLQAELNYLWWVLSCSQDDIRWF